MPFQLQKKTKKKTTTLVQDKCELPIHFVEPLRKRLSVKVKLWNGETVYVTLCKFLTYGCDLLNLRAIKLATYTVCMCSNSSCLQCLCEKYERRNYHCKY